MTPRRADEDHRASTPLELLFDLCFVVAVSQAALQLGHGLVDDHVRVAVTGYLMVFFAIWWAWMNFTWFASAYDTDDVPYRLLTFVQIVGVLVLASGVASASTSGDFTAITIGYVIMRVAMVGQWVRAGRADPEGRAVAYRYAVGVIIVQVGWVLRLFLPHSWGDLSFYVLAVADVTVPIWAERGGRMTPWHPEHISERYGLFTIIVLGECVAASTIAVQSAVSSEGASAGLVGIAAGGLLLVFGLWWWYFDHPADEALRVNPRVAFVWGYAHYAVFASVAALGAALEVSVDTTQAGSGASATIAAVAVAVPVSAFLLVTAVLHTWLSPTRAMPFGAVLAAVLAVAAAAVAVGVAGLALGTAVVLMGAAVALLVGADVVHQQRASA